MGTLLLAVSCGHLKFNLKVLKVTFYFCQFFLENILTIYCFILILFVCFYVPTQYFFVFLSDVYTNKLKYFLTCITYSQVRIG